MFEALLGLWVAPLSFVGGGGGSSKVQKTDYEKQLEQINNSKWERFKKVGRPQEQRLINETARLASPQVRNRAADQAGSAVNDSFGIAEFVPDAGIMAQQIGERSNARGKAVGQARTASHLATEDRYRKGTENVIAMGKGIENTGVNALNRSAQIANAKAYGEAEANATENYARNELIGTAAGYGLYKWGTMDTGRPQSSSQGIGIEANTGRSNDGFKTENLGDLSYFGGTSNKANAMSGARDVSGIYSPQEMDYYRRMA